MQINHYPEIYKKVLGLILQSTVAGLCIWFIARKLTFQEVMRPDLFQLPGFWMVIMVVLLLMLINWSLEAERWRISLPDEKLSFHESVDVVLSGLALNFLVPFTLGDAARRLIAVRHRGRSARAMLFNRAIMITLTSIFGLFSIFFYLQFSFSWAFGILIVLLSITFAAGGRLFDWSGMAPRLMLNVLYLSIIRYTVFVIQFFLLLRWFNPGLDVALICLGIGWVFLFRSFLPSLFGNFGVREASALLFFEPYIENMELILIPCLLIWMVNTVIPSVYGSFSFFKLRFNIAQ